MIAGRFFKYKYQDKDTSAFYYSPIVSAEDVDKKIDTYPIYLSFSNEAISFYLSVKKSKSNSSSEDASSINHLLFEIPLDNDLGEKFSLNLLETIYDENIEEYIGVIYANPDYRFKGYKDIYKLGDYAKVNIFLDFLFDLKHSQVFDTCSNLSRIKKFVTHNFLINAIKSRCEYFFCKLEYIKIDKSKSFNEELFSTRLKQAEENWLDVLFHDDSNIFYFSRWFEENEVEDEMAIVLFKNNTDNLPFDRTQWQKNHFFKYVKDKDVARNNVKKERTNIINFFMKKYEFYEVYRYISKSHISHWVGRIILNQYFIRFFFLVFLVSLVKYELSLFILFFGFFGLLLSVIIPSFRLLFAGFSIVRPTKNKFPSIAHINASAPKMIISILAGWLTLFPFSNELWEWNAKCISNEVWWWIFITILFLIVGLIIFFEIRAINPVQKDKSIIWKLIRVFFTGFSFVVGIGILIFNLSCSYVFDNPEAFPTTSETFKHKMKIQSIVEQSDKLFEISDKLEYLNHLANFVVDEEINTISPVIKYKKKEVRENIEMLSRITTDSIYQIKNSEAIETIRKIAVEAELLKHNSIKEEVIKIAKLEMAKNRVPLIAYEEFFFLGFFIFPRLLILNSLIAFIIGFVIQFIVKSKVYKDTV